MDNASWVNCRMTMEIDGTRQYGSSHEGLVGLCRDYEEWYDYEEARHRRMHSVGINGDGISRQLAIPGPPGKTAS